MAIVKVRVNLKDAKTDAARSRAKSVATTRFIAKRVGTSLSAPKSKTERVKATRFKDERVGAAISKDERFDLDKIKVERLDADIARVEIDGVDICKAKRVMADTARFERAGPYPARSERVGPYTARYDRVGPYTARSERVGPTQPDIIEAGPTQPDLTEAAPTQPDLIEPAPIQPDLTPGPYTARFDRPGPYRSKFGRAYADRVGDEKKVGADRERYERVDAYTARYESAYAAKVGRVVAFNRARIERDGVKRARYEKPSSYTSTVGRVGAYTTKVEGASTYTTRFGRASAYRTRAERIGACRARDDRSSVTLKLKRPRVEDFGNFSKRHRSLQNDEREDHNSPLYHDLVKSSNLHMSTTNGHISQFSDQHVGIVKVTPTESFPSLLKGDSINRKDDLNTSHQGLGKRQLLSDHNHPDTTVICQSFDVSQQHVPYLEVKNRSEVKKDLKVLEDSSAKSTAQNWSKEYQHKTNTFSKNFATNLDFENHHFITERKIQPSLDYHQVYQSSMHVEFATNLSVELEHKDRKMVRGALKAYQEILSKFMTQKCNSRYVKAAMVLQKQGKWVTTTKQVGFIGGVKVGDKFLYRAQLNVVGLHREFDKGIDYMRRNDGKMLATSIVDNGRYVNNLESPDILIYSGQGGKSLYDKTHEPKNQIMEGGNLALRNSQEEGTPVRVIRKLKRYKGSCYVYYGLYTVERVMKEREHGIMIYKFRLRRMSGQPELLFDSS